MLPLPNKKVHYHPIPLKQEFLFNPPSLYVDLCNVTIVPGHQELLKGGLYGLICLPSSHDRHSFRRHPSGIEILSNSEVADAILQAEHFSPSQGREVEHLPQEKSFLSTLRNHLAVVGRYDRLPNAVQHARRKASSAIRPQPDFDPQPQEIGHQRSHEAAADGHVRNRTVGYAALESLEPGILVVGHYRAVRKDRPGAQQAEMFI